MKHNNGYTEQCQDWSDRCRARLDCRIAHAAAPAGQAAARPHPAGHPWIPDHAIHAVWQTALPLCGRTRAWSQILSLGEPSRETPHTDLCAPGNGSAGAAAGGSAADVSHPPRGAVRHRLRITDATRRPVARPDVGGQSSHGGVSDRRDRRWSTGGQHVGTRPKRSPLARVATGGHSPCTRR